MAKAVNQEWFEKLCADVLPKFSEKKPGKLNTFTYTEIWTDNTDGSTFWFYVDVQDNVCVDHTRTLQRSSPASGTPRLRSLRASSSSRATCLQQSLTLAYTRAL